MFLRVITTESWVKLILRIVGTVLLAALLVGGYFYVRDRLRAREEAEFQKFSKVITETSVAAELYRNKKDSFLVVRDSILRENGVTLSEMRNLAERLKADPQKSSALWQIVTTMTDSAVKVQDSLLKAAKKARADSLKADSLKIPPTGTHRDSARAPILK